MKALKQKFGPLLLCLLEVLIGVLLLINPISFTSGIIVVVGVSLAASGLFNLIKYFRTDAVTAAKSQSLLIGLVSLLAGGFCISKSHWFVATFPILTILYGIATLIAGLGKVQWTVDMLRLKKEKWFLAAISAVISIVCSVIILSSPFASTAVLWMFTGVSLIVEAVMDIITLLISDNTAA